MENLQALINESLQLLLIGMGTVFVILVMLIFLITMVSKLFEGYEDEPVHALPSKPVTANANQTPGSQDQLVAVISAAIQVYKQRQSK